MLLLLCQCCCYSISVVTPSVLLLLHQCCCYSVGVVVTLLVLLLLCWCCCYSVGVVVTLSVLLLLHQCCCYSVSVVSWLLNVPTACYCIWICTDSCTCCHPEAQVADKTCSHSDNTLTLGQPVPALTLQHQAPCMVASGAPVFKPLVRINLEKDPR